MSAPQSDRQPRFCSRAARCRRHDHPSSAVLFGATDPLQRVFDSPRARSSADGRPPGPTCPTRRLCAAHAALSPPAALVFVPFCAVEMPSPDGPVRHEMQARASRRQGTLPSSLPHCFCLAPSLTAALPRRRAALSPRPSVRPSVLATVITQYTPCVISSFVWNKECQRS